MGWDIETDPNYQAELQWVDEFVKTESRGGSNPPGFITNAVIDGDEWVLKGEEWFSSHEEASRALQIHGSVGVSHEMPFGSTALESFPLGLADGVTKVQQITPVCGRLRGCRGATDLFPTGHTLRRAEAHERFADILAGAGR